ncbi:hypothetical protein D3C87_1649430 [compost metagenome]
MGLGQLLRRPVRALLLLRKIDVEQFLDQVLEAMPVGIGAGQARGDLGAEHRGRCHAEGVKQHGDIETAEMKDLLAGRVFENGDEVRRLLLAGGNPDHVGGAVPR